MASISDFLDPGGKMLASRLDQFCTTVATLGERLRSTIATILGDTIGHIVRDTTLRVLDNLAGDLAQASGRSWPDEFDPDEEYDWDNDADAISSTGRPATVLSQSKLPAALSAGMQAASWWLRRWTGQSPVITTIAVGLAAAGIAYVGGPMAIVFLGLASTATQFIPLADAGSPPYPDQP